MEVSVRRMPDQLGAFHRDRTRFGDQLSTEIWLMIFEQIAHAEDHAPPTLRLVSQRFCRMATPFVYRKFRIRSQHLIRRPSTIGRSLLSNIRAFTKYLVTDQRLNPARILELLLECHSLQVLEYLVLTRQRRPTVFPRELQQALVGPLSQVQLHVTIQKSNTHEYFFGNTMDFSSFSCPNIVSLAFMNRDIERLPLLALEPLKRLIVQSPKLEALHIVCHKMFESWSPGDGKIPPIKELHLARLWKTNHTVDENAIWDFSKLRLLSLRNVNLPQFVQSLPPHFISGLERFEFSPDPTRFVPPTPDRFDEGLCCPAMLQLIDDNEKIDELLITSSFVPELIHKISTTLGCNLRVLKLRSLDFSDPDISLADVKLLRITCPSLVDFELSVMFPSRQDVAHEDMNDPAFDIVQELGRFRNLSRLKLVSQSPSYDVDQSQLFQNTIIELSRDQKLGVPLSELSIFFHHCKKNNFSFESSLVRYTWDQNGRQACKKSRDRLFVTVYGRLMPDYI